MYYELGTVAHTVN